MLSAISEWIFGASGLEPHGYCLLWEPGLIWLYAVSDGAIALAYFSIPLTLVVIGRRRDDLVYRPMLWLFAAFILLCGTTHWLDLATLWTPLYGLQGLVKAATAVASVATAAALWWTLPKFLALPSEAQLRAANAALLESEERLAQAQKMEAIGQLTGGIAHDFNNLLQVVVGSLSVIEHHLAHGRGNDIKPAVAAIRKASNNASSLINRMLAFSRRQTLLPRVIEPDKLVRGMEEMLRRALGPEVALDMRLGDGAFVVNCDPTQLESALLNLAINARDAMPAGGALTIATYDRTLAADPRDPDLAPGDYVEIEASDSGVGMGPDVLSRVFEPFFTTKANGRGTGLGLSQIYGFVKQSGGFVKVESAPGAGTRVRIFLPGHPRPAGVAAEARRIEADAVSECALQSCRTLLVEDQAEIRAQVADCLKGLGCAVKEACDGTEGLAALQSGAPLDLLVSDVGLPGLSGIQLAEAARAAHPNLPILLITGYAGTSLGSFKLDRHMEVLRKPFTLEELVATTRRLVGGVVDAE